MRAASGLQTAVDFAQEEADRCRKRIGHLERERSRLDEEHANEVRRMQKAMDGERERFAMEIIRLQVMREDQGEHSKEFFQIKSSQKLAVCKKCRATSKAPFGNTFSGLINSGFLTEGHSLDVDGCRALSIYNHSEIRACHRSIEVKEMVMMMK